MLISVRSELILQQNSDMAGRHRHPDFITSEPHRDRREMNRRFFSERPIADDSIQLSGSESQHAVQVLRAQVGDRITVFDGTGCEFAAEITQVKRSGVTLSIMKRYQISREAHRTLVLGVALPKGERQRWLIEKCVELGVHRVVPLMTRRGVAAAKDSVLARLERTIIEASKQCGRNVLMEVGRPCGVAEFITQAPNDSVRWFAHPADADPQIARTDAAAVRSADADQRPVHAAVGPEGGFDPDEVQAAVVQGWDCVTLAETTMRVETAAVAIAAYWLVEPR